MPTPLNYTTKIPAAKTVAEIQELLSKFGAKRVVLSYDDGYPVSVAFAIETSVGMRTYNLPADIDRMMTWLSKQRTNGGMSQKLFRSREHAANVVWRVMKVWLEAQMTLFQMKLIDLEVVMLPYMLVDERRTLAQAWQTGERLALAGSS